ncbi:unnamed protein product [Prorocentrum cordatum]|nr:unnamed protein product [Polarella glacialis]
MCFILAGGSNSETVCMSGSGQDQIQLVNPTQFAHPAESTLALVEGVSSSSNTTLVITCGPRQAGSMSIDIPAGAEALISVGTCFTLEGGGNSETVCILGKEPLQFLSPTQHSYPAGSTLTLLPAGVLVISCGPLEAGATAIDMAPETQALLSVGMCFDLAGGSNSETVCIRGFLQDQIQLVRPTQFAYPAESTLTLLDGVFESSPITLVMTCGPIEAGSIIIDLPVQKQVLVAVGMCFSLEGGGNSEKVCVTGVLPVQLESPTQFAYPAGSTLTLVIPVGPIDAGAVSIEIPSEFLDLVSVGEYFLLEGGGNSEMVCISGFGSILLAEPTQFAYPDDSTLSGPKTLTTTTTSMPHDRDVTSTTGGFSSTTGSNQASVRDDPHVCTLSGDCYDIRVPSEYTLLRLPYNDQEPADLQVLADFDTDGVRPCGLFVKHIALTGSWLNHQVVRIRPYTRDVGGSNWAGSKVITNFSLQLGSSPWRSFTQKESLQVVAVVGQVTVRFVWSEQYGQRMEAQSLQFLVGQGAQPGVLTISQASHQALNLDMLGMGRLGCSRVGGALGTEGHSTALEEPSRECRAAGSVDTRRQKRGAVQPERASTLRASWG